MGLNELTIHELQDKIKKKEITSTEIVMDVFKRIDAVEERVRSFTTMMKEYAFEEAKKADGEIRKGNIKALTGVPIALKDILCTQGYRTTCGSRILAELHPALRRDGRGEAPGRGGRLRRQDEHGRVRHGLLDGERPTSASPATPGTWSGSPAARAAAPRRRWRPTSASPPSAPTRAAPSASRRPSAASSA